MNEQLKALIWKLDREVGAKVEAKEATTSWAREESAKLIQAYSDQQNKELRDQYPIKLHGWEISPETEPNAIKAGIKFKAVNDGDVKSGESVNEMIQEIAEETDDYFWKVTDGFKAEIQRLTKQLEDWKTDKEFWHKAALDKAKEVERLTKEVENERLRLAACGVAALSNTEKSKKEQRLPEGSPYYSASYQDVCDAVDREIRLRELLKRVLKFDYYYNDPADLHAEIDNALNHKP